MVVGKLQVNCINIKNHDKYMHRYHRYVYNYIISSRNKNTLEYQRFKAIYLKLYPKDINLNNIKKLIHTLYIDINGFIRLNDANIQTLYKTITYGNLEYRGCKLLDNALMYASIKMNKVNPKLLFKGKRR